jgi:hypothetical protein
MIHPFSDLYVLFGGFGFFDVCSSDSIINKALCMFLMPRLGLFLHFEKEV